MKNPLLQRYGDLVRGANWSDSKADVYDTDDASYHGDSVQELVHTHQQGVADVEAEK